MSFKDTVISYQGFSPTEFSKGYFDSLIDEVRLESPRGAKIRASCRREKKNLKVILQVRSSAGSFFASAAGTGLHDVSRRLLHQIRRQLTKFKERRYLRRLEEASNYETA